MPYIRIQSGPNVGRVIEVSDDVVSIGRDASCTIQIVDQGVSRRHAEIFRIGELCFIRDLESTNGVYHNKARVREEMLGEGDELLIGSTLLKFELKIPTEAVEPPAIRRAPEKPSMEKRTRHRLSRNMSAAGQIARIFQEEEDVEKVLQKALDFFVQVVDASQVFVVRFDSDSAGIEVRTSAEAEDYAGPRKISRSILKQVIRTNHAMISSNAAIDDRFAHSESVVLQKIHSVICAPMAETPTEVQLLYAHHDSAERSFSKEDLELCGTVAVQLGTVLLSHRRLAERVNRLRGALDAVVCLMESRDPSLLQHGRRVANTAVAIARRMNLEPGTIETLSVAGLIHDVGKFVSNGSDPAAHIEAARAVLEPIEALRQVIPLVVQHHERADGSGYPQGLTNGQIPVPSRILIVANAYDNLIRGAGSAGEAMDPAAAVELIVTAGGREFDGEVAQALLTCLREDALPKARP